MIDASTAVAGPACPTGIVVGGVVPAVVVEVAPVGGVVTFVVVGVVVGVAVAVVVGVAVGVVAVGEVVEPVVGDVDCVGPLDCVGAVLGTLMGFSVVLVERLVVGGVVGAVSGVKASEVVGGIEVSNDGSGGKVESSAIRWFEHDSATINRPTPSMLPTTVMPRRRASLACS